MCLRCFLLYAGPARLAVSATDRTERVGPCGAARRPAPVPGGPPGVTPADRRRPPTDAESWFAACLVLMGDGDTCQSASAGNTLTRNPAALDPGGIPAHLESSWQATPSVLISTLGRGSGDRDPRTRPPRPAPAACRRSGCGHRCACALGAARRAVSLRRPRRRADHRHDASQVARQRNPVVGAGDSKPRGGVRGSVLRRGAELACAQGSAPGGHRRAHPGVPGPGFRARRMVRAGGAPARRPCRAAAPLGRRAVQAGAAQAGLRTVPSHCLTAGRGDRVGHIDPVAPYCPL